MLLCCGDGNYYLLLKRIVAISTVGDVALSCYNAGAGNGRQEG